MADSPIVTAALEFQKLSSEAFWGQRQREDSDLEFQVPEKQWPENVQAMRAGQTVQGVPLPPRVMLSIPSLNQPIQQTYNQWARAHFGIHVAPISKEANTETADIFQGLYRHIEVDSRAYIARGWAYDRAIKAGTGAYRVDVVYDESTEDPDDLKVVIKRILRQSSVYWDPFAVEPDFCDQKRCLLSSWVARDTLKREHPKSKMAGMSIDELIELQSQMPNFATINGSGQASSDKLKWYDGANDAVCIAEYFYTEYQDTPLPGARRTSRKTPIIKWAKINAVEVLDERTWNGKYIPIIPAIGNELQPFDSERRWTGIIGPNKDSARLINYEVSSAVEKDALSTKSPWVGYVGQFKTNQAAWQQANTRNFPYMEVDPIMAGGQIAPLPQRNLQSVDLSSSITLIQLAKEALQTGTSIVDSASLENLAKRKVAHQTLAGMQESNQISQSQYVQNMADLSMAYEAKVVLDLIPRVYDRPGRPAQILGEDGEREEVILNAPYALNPQTQRPIQIPKGSQMLPPGIDKTMQHDLAKGVYSVVVEVGKSYKTKAAEGADALGNIMQAVPSMIPVVGDIWMGYQDFPGHKEAAERMKKMLPPQLADTEEESPEALQQKLAQAGQMIEQLTQQVTEQQKAIETDAVKAEAELKKAQVSAEVDVRKAQLDNETKMRIAQMNAEVELQIAGAKLQAEQDQLALEAGTKAALQDDQQRHEHAESALDRHHESAQLDRQVELAEAQAENDARRQFAQGEVDQAHASEQGERTHEQSMESQSQSEQAAEKQAAMKPKPKGEK